MSLLVRYLVYKCRERPHDHLEADKPNEGCFVSWCGDDNDNVLAGVI